MRQATGWATAVGLAALALGGCSESSLPQPVTADRLAAAEIRKQILAEVGAEAQAEAPAASQAEPTGLATLSGRFVLGGNPPATAALDVTKDVEVCTAGGPLMSHELVVDPATRGIANIVLFADGIPASWVSAEAKEAASGEVSMDQKYCTFAPHVLALQTSQPLKLLNSDPVGHNTNLSPRNNLPFNRIIPSNGFEIYQATTAEPQPFSVACSIHPWMTAFVLVREDPYFAVTGEDGSFTIGNLPAGVPLHFRVWQEKARFIGQATVNGSPANWPRGEFTITLQPGENQEWEIEVAPEVFN